MLQVSGSTRVNRPALPRQPVRLALIAGQLGVGGAEQQLYHFLSGVDRTLLSPVVITLGPVVGEHWEQPIRALDVPVLHVPRSLGRSGRVLRITAILRRLRTTVVHSWAFHANVYAAASGRLAGAAVRFGSMRESYAGLPQSRLWRWGGFQGLDALVTNSNATADELRALGSCDVPVRVVSNGVLVPGEITEGERERLKAALGFSPSDQLIGTVGRLDENKNQSMLLRAFERIAPQWPQLRLVIIGDGPSRDKLAAEAAQRGVADRVTLLGVLSGAARYLPAFDICCLTSRTEGTPNLLMEAAAAGIPVVATDVGGSREIVTSNVTGYLVTSDDDVELASRLGALLKDPGRARRMGECGREKVRREFSVDVMVSRMTSVYFDELARKHPSGFSAEVGNGCC